MATINPSYQKFFDLPDGQTIGVTRFKITDTNNSIPLSPPVYTSEGAAGAQVSDVNDSIVTSQFYILSNGTYNLNNQAASLVGKEVTFVSIHKTSNGTGS